MGKYQPKEYYDGLFRNQRISIKYKPPWPLSTEWYTRLREVAKLIDKDRTVIDMGCGFGILAGMLSQLGHIGVYRGYDFAKETIVWVNQQHAYETIHPNARFIYADFTEKMLTIPAEEKPTVVMGEFLEHIPNDQEVVGALPCGTDTIITLPSFDDPGHVRWFPSAEAVRARYDRYIDFKYCGDLYTEGHYAYGQGVSRWLAVGERK